MASALRQYLSKLTSAMLLLGLGSLAILSTVFLLYERALVKQRQLPQLASINVWHAYAMSVTNFFQTNEVVQSYCMKFGNRLFTIPLLGQWCIMVKAPGLVREFYNAPEEVLSMEKAAEELLQLRHIVGPQFVEEVYHIPAIRSTMNKHLATVIPAMLHEMVHAVEQEVGNMCGDKEWMPIKALDRVTRIICRISNRVFVGLPLCRDEDYINLTSKFSNQVIVRGAFLRFLVPPFLRRPVGMCLRVAYGYHRRILTKLEPLLELRRRNKEAQITLPNDMVTWLMEEGDYSNDSLAMRILNVNFVALHTTTKAFTHALYHLAAQPSYIAPLREEIASQLDVTDISQWNRESLSRCLKLDSFFKETMRLNGLGALWMPRVAVADFTFSDGTTVPAGNFLATAVTAIHEDEGTYRSAKVFEGFRFAEKRQLNEQSDEDWMHRLTGTSATYLTFGGGRHICPGRFFAALELKFLMAYLLIHYDVRMDGDGIRPADEWLGPTSNPAADATVLFRRRSVTI